MPRLITRLVLTILLIPLTIFVMAAFAMLTETFVGYRDEGPVFSVAFTVLAAAFGAGILFIWRGVVRWTPRRRLRTWLVTGGAVAAFVLFALPMLLYIPNEDLWQPMIPVTAAILTLIWAGACTFVWHESPAERLARVSNASVSGRTCPACKYDLSGLTNLRCPECGAVWTLGKVLDEHKARAAPPSFD